ncbi:MAG: PhzF family phenazine biosynthesis protein [Bacteroidota bacterium]
MSITITQVDAFTSKPFSGNPAAVCILPAPRDKEWMQNVAMEMNLSETAFLHPAEEGFNLRWFTPKVEVELCGHATLASAHVLWEQGYIAPDKMAVFHSKSGKLTAQRNNDWITLNFPAAPESPAPAPPGLIEALGCAVKYIGKNKFDYLVEVETARIVRELKPNFSLLAGLGVRGVMVTSRSDTPQFDIVSRFFAPGAGIDEDPVTGSAHCCLAPFWKARLNKNEMMAYQASARGGILKLKIEGDRVLLSGQAVTVFKGELFA